MSKYDLQGDFFPELLHFAHKDIFNGIKDPWMVLPAIRDYILRSLPKNGNEELPSGLVFIEGVEPMLYCQVPVELRENLIHPMSKIFIGVGTRIEPSAIIKGPAIIGKKCDIRHGAYLRGDLVTGDSCTLGHATEIKNSIIMNHSEMGHFNYIGDCVIGSFVNLGAGTKLANLKFRTPQAKKAIMFPEISFRMGGETISTGISKFGAIVGDYCELGCNSVTSPAVLLGAQCFVYPNFTVASGYYPPRTFLRPS